MESSRTERSTVVRTARRSRACAEWTIGYETREETQTRNSIRASAIAILCSGVGVFAQAGATPQAPRPSTETTPAAAAASQASTTLSGCVYRERDVPGRTPNLAERAGVLEDYILVASADTSAGTVGTTGTTPPAAGAATPMPKAFKLEKISDDKLFYCSARGIGEEDAVSMIVDGFCKQVFRELPMEFAVEAKKLLEISLEGAVGWAGRSTTHPRLLMAAWSGSPAGSAWVMSQVWSTSTRDFRSTSVWKCSCGCNGE